jgi:predicted small lipoprotein YifL
MYKKSCLIIALMLILSLSLSACGTRGELPEQAVTNALNAVKNVDKETMQKYFGAENSFWDSDSGADGLIKDEENLKLLFNKLTYKVISATSENDTATVKTEITNMDLAAVMAEFFQQSMSLAFSNAFGGENAKSEEEITKEAERILIDLMKKEDNETVTATVDIKLTKNEDGWLIDAGDEFTDAVTGGLVSAIENMASGFGGADSLENKAAE